MIDTFGFVPGTGGGGGGGASGGPTSPITATRVAVSDGTNLVGYANFIYDDATGIMRAKQQVQARTATLTGTAQLSVSDTNGFRAVVLQYDYNTEIGLLWGGEWSANGLLEWNDNAGTAKFDRDYAYDWLFGGQSILVDTQCELWESYTNAKFERVRSVSSNTTLDTDYCYVRYTSTGGHTLTLPTNGYRVSGAPSSSSIFGKKITIKNRGTGNVTIDAGTGRTIEAAQTLTLSPGQSIDLIAVSTTSWDVT